MVNWLFLWLWPFSIANSNGLPTVTPPHPWLGPSGLGTLWPPQRQARRDAWVAQHPDAMLLSIGVTFLDIQFLKMRHPLTTIHFFVCQIYIYIIYTYKNIICIINTCIYIYYIINTCIYIYIFVIIYTCIYILYYIIHTCIYIYIIIYTCIMYNIYII